MTKIYIVLPGMPETFCWQYSPFIFLALIIIVVVVAYLIYFLKCSREQGN